MCEASARLGPLPEEGVESLFLFLVKGLLTLRMLLSLRDIGARAFTPIRQVLSTSCVEVYTLCGCKITHYFNSSKKKHKKNACITCFFLI